MPKLLVAISKTTHFEAERIDTVRTEQEILDALNGPHQYIAFILDGEKIGLYNRSGGRGAFNNPLYTIFEAARKKHVPVHYFRSDGLDQIDFISHPDINIVDSDKQAKVLETLLLH